MVAGCNLIPIGHPWAVKVTLVGDRRRGRMTMTAEAPQSPDPYFTPNA